MPSFTDADIRASTSAQSYSRGVEYYEGGAVLDLVRRGDEITAEVEGSEYEPYEITVMLGEAGDIRSAGCTCPYDYGGYCKHIVAVLLAVMSEPESVETKQEIEIVLAGLTEAQLRAILLRVAAEGSRIADLIEREATLLRTTATPPIVATMSSTPSTATLPVPTLDLAAVRRELRRDFRKATSTGGGGYRDYDDDYDDEVYIDTGAILGGHVKMAETLLATGDPASAAELMASVIEQWSECIADLEDWVYDANEDVLADAASEIDTLLAESLLSQPLSDAERQAWRKRIDQWADEMLPLSVSDGALVYWWDHPPLVAAMQGHVTEQGAWEDDTPDFADSLALVRLNVLERQGRVEEYLNLAQVEGELVLYLLKLVQIGQIVRAVAETKQQLIDSIDILRVARALAERGYRQEALVVATHGFDAPTARSAGDLARWAIPIAEAEGNRALALRAARIAFFDGCRLTDYQAVERIAGADWPTIKEALLARLKEADNHTAVDIYLYERMLPEVIEIIDSRFYYGDMVRIIEATRADYPDWAIPKCIQPAESIMNSGKANRYHEAVQWLRRARDIYAQHNRLAEWQPYLSGLLDTHARKYKLVPMLKALR